MRTIAGISVGIWYAEKAAGVLNAKVVRHLRHAITMLQDLIIALARIWALPSANGGE